jgi:hypothetical protein
MSDRAPDAVRRTWVLGIVGGVLLHDGGAVRRRGCERRGGWDGWEIESRYPSLNGDHKIVLTEEQLRDLRDILNAELTPGK